MNRNVSHFALSLNIVRVCVCTDVSSSNLYLRCLGFMHISYACIWGKMSFSFLACWSIYVWLCSTCVCVWPLRASEGLWVMEEKGKRSRRQAEQWDHVMVETFGNGSHKHTHTQTHKHARITPCMQTHTPHTHMLACFCSPVFEAKKGKMTSSSSCEANETDEGGGENTGRNRTLLHKTQLGTGLLWALLSYYVCPYVHAFARSQEFVRVKRFARPLIKVQA